MSKTARTNSSKFIHSSFLVATPAQVTHGLPPLSFLGVSPSSLMPEAQSGTPLSFLSILLQNKFFQAASKS